MADSKTTALTELTAVAEEDVIYIVDDPSGTPTPKKATVANFLNAQAGKKFLPARLGYPSTTNGCAALAQTEYGTNDVDLETLDFDQTTIEYAQFLWEPPSNYDGGTITFQAAWTAAAGSAAQTVEWNLQARAFQNNDAIDQAWGSSIEVSDALIATDDWHVSSVSAAVTIAGTPGADTAVMLRVWRDATNDNLAADAKLIGLKIFFAKDQS